MEDMEDMEVMEDTEEEARVRTAPAP